MYFQVQGKMKKYIQKDEEEEKRRKIYSISACKRKHDSFILDVFRKIDDNTLRTAFNGFKNAFTSHETKFDVPRIHIRML